MIASAGDRAAPRRWPTPAAFAARHAMLIALLLLVLLFAATAPHFGSRGNAVNILRQAAPILLLGLAMALVTLVGGIDLSVGSVVLASATLSGIVLAEGLSPGLAILAAIAAGAGVGLVNAALVEGLRISPVIVTLGTMIAVRGLGLVALGRYNSWIEIRGPVFRDLARGTVLGLPLDAVLAVLLALAVHAVLAATTLGRAWYAAGDAPVAARLAGLHVGAVRAAAYVGCGAIAGAAGVLVAARTGLISPSVGLGLEFLAIAVVALGAGGLPVGRLRVGQVVVGTLILTIVFNYMTLRGVPGTWQTTVTGALLVLAMLAGLATARGTAGAPGAEELPAGEAPAGSAAARLLARNGLALATLGLALAFAALVPRFASWPNLVALVEQNAVLAIVAVGAMIGIVSRTVDIAPGSAIALGAVAAALAGRAGLDWPLALLAGGAAVVAVYALNGLLAGPAGLDPLLVTLAAWIWARGLAVSLTDASTLPFDPAFVALMATPLAAGFTPALPLVLAAFLAGWLILRRSPLGLRAYALGGDPRMVRQAGIDEGRLRLALLCTMGLFTAAGMAAMLGRLGAAAPTAGFGLELDAIVAVILGGAAFRGGSGRVRETAIGVAFLAILNNGLSGMQMGDAQFFLIKGTVILAALVLRAALARRSPRSGAA